VGDDKTATERAALEAAIFDDGSRSLAGALAPDANLGISRNEGSLMLAFSHLAQRAIEDVYADCGDTDAGVLSSNVGQYIAREVHAVLFGEPDGVLRHPAADRVTVAPDRAEVVTICGSSKFRDEILSEVARLTMEGKLVISLGMFGHHDFPDLNWDTDATDLKRMLDALHRQKIDMADRVHVVTVGGYYGESTAREIEYARSLGKPVTFGDVEPVASGVLGAPADHPTGRDYDTAREQVAQAIFGAWQVIDSAEADLNKSRIMADGVLYRYGVPAVQRTADRETIARALQRANRPDNDMRNRDQREADEDSSWPAYLALADAVLAVLVPADQVRAETMDEAASFPIPGFEHWTESKKDAASRYRGFLHVRAVEYRKQAGA